MSTGDASASSTVGPFLNSTTLKETSVGELAVRATFLAIFLILGFVGNSILIATIAQSKQLKGGVMNLSIISIAVVNLVDTIVNMPLILGASISENWDYGEFACHLNTFSMQLVSIVMIMGLFLMTIDRLLAVVNIEAYPARMTVLISNILIIYSWTHGFVLSLPMIINVVPNMAYPARYSCSLAPTTTVVYIACVSVIGYVIPIIGILVIYIVIIKMSICVNRQYRGGDNDVQNRSARSKGGNIAEEDDTDRLTAEIDAAKYVGVLIILYCIFEGPYLLLTAIEQYKNSKQLSSIKEITTVLDFSYPWQLDVSFTWLKLSYAIVLPVVTFFWRREVWLKFKNCVCCNRLSSKSKTKKNKSSSSDGKNSATNSLSSRNKKKELSNGSIPVLFAAEGGLQFQTAIPERDVDSQDGDSDAFPTESENNNSTSVASQMGVVRSRKCDVLGSGFIQAGQDQDDTSDYDSQGDETIDPYSNSIPVSIKSKGSHASSKKSHSNSGHSGNGKLKSLKEELSNAIEDTKSENSKQQGKAARNKKEKKQQETTESTKTNTKSDVLPDVEKTESASVRTRSDSGNGSWEKQNGRKKQKNKKRVEQQQRNNTFQLENETVNAHSVTEDVDEEEDYNLLAENYNADLNIELEEARKVKKKKKKKKRKKEDGEDDISEMNFDNDAFSPSPNESAEGNNMTNNPAETGPPSRQPPQQHKRQPSNTEIKPKHNTISHHEQDNEGYDDDDDIESLDKNEDKLFLKVKPSGGRPLPASPAVKKNKRRHSDDFDVTLNLNHHDIISSDRSPKPGAKTDRGPQRFLSHDDYLQQNFVNRINEENIRPLPNPRKAKQQPLRVLSGVDNETFVIDKANSNGGVSEHGKKASYDSGNYHEDSSGGSYSASIDVDSFDLSKAFDSVDNNTHHYAQQKHRKKKSLSSIPPV